MSARACLPALLALAAAAGLSACACDESALQRAALDGGERSSSLCGTVVDAQTREPVAGAELVGPGDLRAKSDAAGRFLMGGLLTGASGELVATGPDGSTGRIPILPLRPGSLEVVVHLRWH